MNLFCVSSLEITFFNRHIMHNKGRSAENIDNTTTFCLICNDKTYGISFGFVFSTHASQLQTGVWADVQLESKYVSGWQWYNLNAFVQDYWVQLDLVGALRYDVTSCIGWRQFQICHTYACQDKADCKNTDILGCITSNNIYTYLYIHVIYVHEL